MFPASSQDYSNKKYALSDEQQRNANALYHLDSPDVMPHNPIERFVLHQQEVEKARTLADKRQHLDQQFVD